MNIPILDIIVRMGPYSYFVLAVLGIIMLYFILPEKIYGLMFFLTLSATFVGSSISFIADIASLLRWGIILLLLVSSFLFGSIRLSYGMLLFWGYVLLGLVSLFGSKQFLWQFQRGMLLLMVALAIPIAFGDKPYRVYKLSLISIAIVGSIFAIYSFIPMQSQLSDAARVMGLSRGASDFSMDLGCLLPFTFWGIWMAASGTHSKGRMVQWFCGLGFFAGVITLFLSGQRAGLVAGLVGILPMLLMLTSKKKAFWGLAALLLVLFVAGYFLLMRSGSDRIDFLASRYSPDAGLSDRDWIWRLALSEISENPIWGRGIGAAETVFRSSFHNAYLEVWLNTGIFGLLFYLGAQAYFFYRIVVSWMKYPGIEARSILALAFGYMLGFVALCMVESVGAAASTINVILYLFLGVVVSNDAILRCASGKGGTQPALQPRTELQTVTG